MKYVGQSAPGGPCEGKQRRRTHLIREERQGVARNERDDPRRQATEEAHRSMPLPNYPPGLQDAARLAHARVGRRSSRLEPKISMQARRQNTTLAARGPVGTHRVFMTSSGVDTAAATAPAPAPDAMCVKGE